jgi:uncharacterized membrane protein YfcA
MMLRFDRKNIIYAAAGILAGILNGLFGAGGGLILVPMLVRAAKLDVEKALPTSIAVILPMCIVSCIQRYSLQHFELSMLWPYLAGGLIGGIAGGLTYKKVPKIWLRRILGLFILYAGVKMILNF